MSALPLASARFIKLWILLVKDLLDGDVCQIYLFPYFLFFLIFIMILSYTLILPISQISTQQVMTSQVTSHIEYLIQTYYILVLIL